VEPESLEVSDVTALSQSVPILFLTIRKHKRSQRSQAVTQLQTQVHLNWVCGFMSLWLYNMGL